MPAVPASPSLGVPLFLPLHFLSSPARNVVPGSPALVPSQGNSSQHPYTPPSNLFTSSLPSATPYGFLRTPGTAVPRTAGTLLQVPITPFPGKLTKASEQQVPSRTPAPATSAPRNMSQSSTVQIDDLFQENIFEESHQPNHNSSTPNDANSTPNATSVPASAARELDLFEDES